MNRYQAQTIVLAVPYSKIIRNRLGSRNPFTQTDARCPTGRIMGQRLDGRQAALAAKRPDGR